MVINNSHIRFCGGTHRGDWKTRFILPIIKVYHTHIIYAMDGAIIMSEERIV